MIRERGRAPWENDRKTELMSKPRRKTKPLDAAERIARDIQSGLFAPGMWLKQIDLEQRYGCTRLEIRRALDRLAQRRLVQHVLNRGYHVYEPDGRQAAEVLEIRAILETAAADSIVAQADAAAVERLTALASRFDALILDGTILEQYETNLEFHGALLALCANRELATLATDLRGRMSSAPANQWRTRARIEQSAREHHAMVAALAARDAAALKQLLALHIRQPEAPAEAAPRPALRRAE
jgi:DNA-binding GntR family transcriptional regulator